MKLPTDPKNILIIKPSSLGDVITAVPVLRALRRKFPQAKLSWLVAKSCLDVIEGDPDLSDIIVFDRKKLGKIWRSPAAFAELLKLRAKIRNAKFDLVIDLQGLLRSGFFTSWSKSPARVGFANAREGATLFYNFKHMPKKIHTVDRNTELAEAIGVEVTPADFKLNVTEQAKQFVSQIIADNNLTETGYFVCVPPTRWVTKLYPARYWRQVVAELTKIKPVVLLGSPAKFEVELCESVARDQAGKVINLAGKTTLKQLVGVISQASGVICSDSAAQFIAPGTQTPCLSLIGPTKPERTGPFWGLGKALVADIPCQGCLKKRCHHISCMQSLSPDLVVRTALEMFDIQ